MARGKWVRLLGREEREEGKGVGKGIGVNRMVVYLCAED